MSIDGTVAVKRTERGRDCAAMSVDVQRTCQSGYFHIATMGGDIQPAFHVGNLAIRPMIANGQMRSARHLDGVSNLGVVPLIIGTAPGIWVFRANTHGIAGPVYQDFRAVK